MLAGEYWLSKFRKFFIKVKGALVIGDDLKLTILIPQICNELLAIKAYPAICDYTC